MNSLTTIAAEEFSTLKGALVIDVRTPAEFAELFLDGSHNIPLGDIGAEHVNKLVSGHTTVYLLCGTGMRATKAAEQLAASVSPSLMVIGGGIQSLAANGCPLVQGESKVISLERQVRIAAGLLVVLGGLLSIVLHPWFILLSVFVGAGLCFAGITNTCGMGMMLARMPWNTRAATS